MLPQAPYLELENISRWMLRFLPIPEPWLHATECNLFVLLYFVSLFVENENCDRAYDIFSIFLLSPVTVLKCVRRRFCV